VITLPSHTYKLLSKGLRYSALLTAMCAAVLPLRAQAPGDLRVALVIGNAAYAGPAALSNPTNDAKAMGDTLRGLGFSVVEVKDGTKAQMTEAIAKVKSTLQGKQAIGMLYYAGHGLQVDWRNYMVPIDAKMSQASEVPAQTVDLSQVIDAFKSAGNRMNIVVLDACRDNPFAGTATGKGLAQLDAPTGTFLAYATAPGNVAEDGDSNSANGLYTQFLLQELKRPISKIEDVFKRTRLNVRTASSGRQIPWESTSLEEDFFFRKPSAVVLSPDQLEAQFKQQLERWNSIEASKDVQVLQAFLLDYPSGSFSELAQFRFDRLLKEQQRQQAEQQALARITAEKQAAEAALQEQAKQAALAKAAQEQADLARRESERLVVLERSAAEDKQRVAAAEQIKIARQEQDRQELLAKQAQQREVQAQKAAEKAQAAQQQKLALETQKIISAQQLTVAKRQNDKPRDSDVISMDRNFKVGMRATYSETAWSNKKETQLRYRVDKINDTTVQLNQGRVVWDLMGNVLVNRNGKYSSPRQFYPAEFQVGKRWNTRVMRERTDGGEDLWDIDVRVAGRETIEVPAGKFEAYLIKAQGWRTIGSYQQRWEWKIWVSPGVPFDIARESTVHNSGKMVEQTVTKLSTFQPS
jgi:pyruvate/2-oxoglutarate dehydrogenase complex dihydrolipoamide acyltransferase (E2) component